MTTLAMAKLKRVLIAGIRRRLANTRNGKGKIRSELK